MSLEDIKKSCLSEMFDEAQPLAPKHEGPWLVLIDGNKALQTSIRKAARARGVEVAAILHAIQALQHLLAAENRLHEEGSAQPEQWVLERFEHLLQGKARDVAAGTRRSATKRGLDAKRRAPIDKAAKHFRKRNERMQGDLCLKADTPIAPGVSEAACRALINDRLDITGARWRLAEATLKLGAILRSGDFDAHRALHTDRECQRNHATRNADERPPDVVLPRSRPHLRLVG